MAVARYVNDLRLFDERLFYLMKASNDLLDIYMQLVALDFVDYLLILFKGLDLFTIGDRSLIVFTLASLVEHH